MMSTQKEESNIDLVATRIKSRSMACQFKFQMMEGTSFFKNLMTYSS